MPAVDLPQSPGLVEEACVSNVRDFLSLIDPQYREISILRCREISGPIFPIRRQAAVDYNITGRAGRIRINERRYRLGGGEALAAECHRLLRPADRRLSIQRSDPAITARIAK